MGGFRSKRIKLAEVSVRAEKIDYTLAVIMFHCAAILALGYMTADVMIAAR